MIESGRVRLPVANVERAVRFYIERLGVKLVASTPCARIDLGGGFEIDLVAGAVSAPTALELVLRGSFEEALGTYENRGLALVRGNDGTSPFAECTDLDGHRLRFVPGPART